MLISSRLFLHKICMMTLSVVYFVRTQQASLCLLNILSYNTTPVFFTSIRRQFFDPLQCRPVPFKQSQEIALGTFKHIPGQQAGKNNEQTGFRSSVKHLVYKTCVQHPWFHPLAVALMVFIKRSCEPQNPLSQSQVKSNFIQYHVHVVCINNILNIEKKDLQLID